MVKVREDLTDRIFGKLKVIEQAEDYIDSKGIHLANWKCQCECGKFIIITGKNLKNEHTQSCGCLKKEKVIQRNQTVHKKYNSFEICGDYVTMYTSKGEPFYVDLEDFDKVKDICWYIDKDGYCRNRNGVLLHRLIMSPSNDDVVDHINHNKRNNRKNNLRTTTQQQNSMNAQISKNNTSGVTGVSWYKKYSKWVAYIRSGGRTINLGYFENYNDAVKARKEAEDKYFGEYSYDNSQKIGGHNEVSTDRN